MSIRKILTVGNTQLREKSQEISTITEDIKALCADMVETMQAANGLGLAAPQIGILQKVVIIDFGYLEHDQLVEKGEKGEDDDFETNPVALINPTIVSIEGNPYTMEEGCLSIPHYRANVSRPSVVTCQYTTLDGTEVVKIFQNLGASAIQHELDHLNGILFIDHIGRLKRNSALRTVKRFLATVEQNGSEYERRLYGNA
ncbi:peptide deformylase [bacterium]|nr:peptide deformylase [bacterium]